MKIASQLGVLTAAVLSLTGSACGAPAAQVVDTTAKKPTPVVEAPKEPNAYRDFRGTQVKLGEPFRLAAESVGVAGAEVVLTLVKAEWSTMTSPSGKEIKEISVNLRIQHGQEERGVQIAQGEKRVIGQYRYELIAGGEEYNKARMVYEPWVQLRLTPAE
jgi:hypothetical protein